MTLPSGSILPSADVLNDYEHGRFVLSNLAAKRAKQLKEGAPPLVRVPSSHPLTIALAEIAAGKIRPILGKEDVGVAIVDQDVTAIPEETLTGDFGLLLPALEDSEIELITKIEEDHEHEHEDEPEADEVDIGGPSTLSDLLGDGEPEEPAPAAGADETLSLTDIAEEEESLDADEDSDD